MSKFNKEPGEDFTPEEVSDLGMYLTGYAAAMNSNRLCRCAEFLLEASEHICAQGYIGCDGGKECTSDHK